jgi:rhodanese-related sulfurtransferase
VTAFPDVPAGHAYEAAIDDLSARGIIGGYKNGDFGPNDPVKRAQVAKMVVGTLGITPNTSTATRFTDLDDPDAYGYPHRYVQTAYDNGITYGTNTAGTLFSPWSSIRRDQLVTMVVRGAKNGYPGALAAPPAGTASLFAGVPEPHGANLRMAEYNHLLGSLIGMGTSWSVTANATRGEMAQMLRNLIACLAEKRTYETVDVLTTYERLSANPEAQLIDVREPYEWAATGVPPGALLISLADVERHAFAELAWDRPVYVICKAGARSRQAAETLIRLGFTEVYNVNGGIQAWLQAWLPVEAYNPDGEEPCVP